MESRRAFDKWKLWVIILLIAITSVLSYGVAKLNQNINSTLKAVDSAQRAAKIAAELSEHNNRFLDNFSNYMNCLIVNEDEVVVAVGEEAYVEICKLLLYKGIDPIPPTIKATIPPEILTTTTTGG